MSKGLVGCCKAEAIEGDRSDWITGLGDEFHVSQMSIPGTHESVSFHGLGAQCQSVPLDKQLMAGIRALDIRCYHDGNTFHMYHGIYDQKKTFWEVLITVRKFLERHPRETVYMIVQEMNAGKGKNTRSFEDTFREEYWNKQRDLFWDPVPHGNCQNPTLGITRGRVVVIQNFSSKQLFGILFKDNQVAGIKSPFVRQNEYDLGAGDISGKWKAVRTHLELTNRSRQSGKIYMNFLSGFGVFTWPGTVASEINTNTVKCLGKGREFSQHAGIVYCDYPSKDLIESIIALNK